MQENVNYLIWQSTTILGPCVCYLFKSKQGALLCDGFLYYLSIYLHVEAFLLKFCLLDQ